MASVRHLEFAKFRFFWTNIRPGHWNLYLLTKFYLNRIIHGWDIEIKLFSKWRPSAILNLRKLLFWSRDLYLHVIFHLRSKFRFNRPMRRDIAKNDFKYGVRPPSWICKISIFVKYPSWELKSVSAYQILSKSNNSWLRYWDKAVFKMAAVRYLEFAKIAVLVTCPLSACDSSSPLQISL